MMISSDKLVLHRLNYYSSKRSRFFFSLLLLLIFLFFLYTLFGDPSQVLNWSTEDWLQWLSNTWKKIKDEPTTVIWSILSLLLPFLHLVYINQIHYRERLFLTSSEIQYQSPMPFFLQWLKPDWSIKWSMIKTAYFKPAKLGRGPLAVFMVIETSSLSKKIIPCIWIDPNNLEQSPSLLQSQWQSFNPQQTKLILPSCPVIKYFTLMGIDVKTEQIDNNLSDKSFEFALESNPHSLIAVILLLTFLIYASVDSIINSETYIDKSFYQIYLWSGVVTSIIVMGWQMIAKVPKSESFAVGLFFGGALGVALYPGLLRINQLTDTQGLQTYQYVLQSDYSLKSLDNDELPRLFFKTDLDYWSHFEPDSIHEIELRKGGLEFYQINMAPIYADMRQYFRSSK